MLKNSQKHMDVDKIKIKRQNREMIMALRCSWAIVFESVVLVIHENGRFCKDSILKN